MCFEILGFDVIVDNELKPSILEVNYTPSFATDTPLDKTIKENLIKESITLMNITQKVNLFNYLGQNLSCQYEEKVVDGKDSHRQKGLVFKIGEIGYNQENPTSKR